MCSGFTHQHTVEETYPRSQTVNPPPPPPFIFTPPSFDSILPFLTLNTLPLAKLQHSFGSSPPPSLPLCYQSSLPAASPPTSSPSPENSIMLSLLVSFMSFTCQQRRERANRSPTKEKHPPVISENAAGWRGRREEDRQGDRGR